jgi:PPM family protein phosphatase
MKDDWFYIHDGATYGPAPTAALRLLAAGGKLGPDDPVWAEGASPTTAVLARTVVPFPESTAPKGAAPDWLGDVRTEERRALSTGNSRPDWLEGIRQAEEAEAAFGMVPSVGAMPAELVLPPSGKAPPPLPGAKPPPLGSIELVLHPAPSAPTGAGLTRGTTASTFLATTGQGKLDIGSATSPGKVRPANEDSHLVLQATWANLDLRHELAVVVVADGMGGHKAGERASGLTIRAMGNSLAALLSAAVGGTLGATADVLPRSIDLAFALANQAVADAATADADCKGMGATVVAVVLSDDEVHIGLAGDCRVYHQRGDQLTQVTRDQTLVARMVELGQLTPSEAANHPRGNEVTQAVGLRGAIQPARYELKLRPGDWLVACCDGLPAHVEDGLLQKTISQWATSPAAALAHHLVELANQRGGSDNCTVVAVRRNGG